MIIRPYDASDHEQLIALWRETGLAMPQNNPERDIQRKLAVDADLFLVALDKQCLVGSVMGGYEGHRGWINYLGVKPSYQRQGIASRLMREVEALLKRKGCPKINLQIRRANESALGFYKALGYLDDNVIGLGKRLERD